MAGIGRLFCHPRPTLGRLAGALALLLCIAAAPAQEDEKPAVIAIAASLGPWLDDAQDRFQRQSSYEVLLARGSTGKHYSQILHGAPFDALIAADSERPQRLIEAGKAQRNEWRRLALGQLVLWSPHTPLPGVPQTSLSAARSERLVIANPRLAPYGLAAQEVLISLGAWPQWQHKLIRAENAAQAAQFVASGHAALGLIPAVQLSARQREDKSHAWLIPPDLHQPVEHDAVVLSNHPAARAFVEFLANESEQVLRQFGLRRALAAP